MWKSPHQHARLCGLEVAHRFLSELMRGDVDQQSLNLS
jgi:hypothetical protein